MNSSIAAAGSVVTEQVSENEHIAPNEPNYAAVRSRTLSKLKVGRQSTAGKAIDAFIKELGRTDALSIALPKDGT